MLTESILSLLGTYRTSLTENERRLVEALTADPDRALFMSGRQLARSAGVHESTLVRLSQKLGFDGYPAFRRAMLDLQQRAAAGPSLRVARTLASAADGELWPLLVSHEVESLLTCQKHISQAQLDEAADMLGKARHVYIWATGNAKILADLLDRRMRSSGLPARNIAYDGRELAERLVMLGPDDVVVAFAFRRTPRVLPLLLRHARACQARSLLIADMLGHTLPDAPDLMLAAPRGDSNQFLTLNVPMLITNALLLTLARHDQGRSLAGLETLEKLRRELGSFD